MQFLTPFEKLAAIVDKLEQITTPGYNRTYYKNQAQVAIASFEKISFLKYFVCAPRYHKLIQKAKKMKVWLDKSKKKTHKKGYKRITRVAQKRPRN